MGCDYVAESSIEDFKVCAWHDRLETLIILESLQAPGVIGSLFRKEGTPKLFCCGKLTEQHFVPRESFCGIKASEDPLLVAAVTGNKLPE